MFQQLLNLLPHEPGTITLIVAAIGSLAGLGLWLTGARFSRPILTLTAVALGTGIGMKLPKWCGWSIDPMAPAVGLAFILGLSAFALHRFWVGLWLGLVVAAWTSLALWGVLGHTTQWHWPAYHHSQTFPKYMMGVWANLPKDIRKWLPYVTGGAVLSGVLTTILWPRLSIVLLWSAAGTSLILAMGSVALSRFDPAILSRLPRPFWSQLAMLGGLVIVGTLLQWRLTPNFRPKSTAPRSDSQEKSN